MDAQFQKSPKENQAVNHVIFLFVELIIKVHEIGDVIVYGWLLFIFSVDCTRSFVDVF